VRVPLVVLIVNVYTFGLFELQDIVAVPELLILEGEMDPHVSPEGGLSVIVMVPEKPLSGVKVIVDVEEEPGATAAGEDAVTVKSWNLNVAPVEWVSDPLEPLIVRW
jgi:hypothetical protein